MTREVMVSKRRARRDAEVNLETYNAPKTPETTTALSESRTEFYVFLEATSSNAKLRDPMLISNTDSLGYYGPDDNKVVRVFLKPMNSENFSEFVEYYSTTDQIPESDWRVFYRVRHVTESGLVVETEPGMLEIVKHLE